MQLCSICTKLSLCALHAPAHSWGRDDKLLTLLPTLSMHASKGGHLGSPRHADMLLNSLPRTCRNVPAPVPLMSWVRAGCVPAVYIIHAFLATSKESAVRTLPNQM